MEQRGSATLLREEVTEEEIAEVISRWAGIPLTKLLEGDREKLLKLDTVLHERVIGQDPAVSVVANAIRRSRAGLSDPNRPIGSFLFLGPTGVGKTEVTRGLASFLFSTERNLIRGCVQQSSRLRDLAPAPKVKKLDAGEAELGGGEVAFGADPDAHRLRRSGTVPPRCTTPMDGIGRWIAPLRRCCLH